MRKSAPAPRVTALHLVKNHSHINEHRATDHTRWLWHAADQANRDALTSSGVFKLSQRGLLTVNDTGLYFVYAQVGFFCGWCWGFVVEFWGFFLSRLPTWTSRSTVASASWWTAGSTRPARCTDSTTKRPTRATRPPWLIWTTTPRSRSETWTLAGPICRITRRPSSGCTSWAGGQFRQRLLKAENCESIFQLKWSNCTYSLSLLFSLEF